MTGQDNFYKYFLAQYLPIHLFFQYQYPSCDCDAKDFMLVLHLLHFFGETELARTRFRILFAYANHLLLQRFFM